MDYYEVLGIENSATQQDIKAAYRKLAAKYHPDVNDAANASAFFRLINQAYETLYNVEQRGEYDNKSGGATQQAPPAPEQAQQQYDHRKEPQNNDFNFRRVEVAPVKRIGLFLLLIPFKIIAAVLLLLSMFFQAISLVLSSIANLVGRAVTSAGRDRRDRNDIPNRFFNGTSSMRNRCLYGIHNCVTGRGIADCLYISIGSSAIFC